MVASLSDVITEIGNENVELQLLDSSMVGFKQHKHDITINFATSLNNSPRPNATFNSFLTPKLGMIVWVDRAEYEKAVNTVAERNRQKESQ